MFFWFVFLNCINNNIIISTKLNQFLSILIDININIKLIKIINSKIIGKVVDTTYIFILLSLCVNIKKKHHRGTPWSRKVS